MFNSQRAEPTKRSEAHASPHKKHSLYKSNYTRYVPEATSNNLRTS